jgi:CARDB protein
MNERGTDIEFDFFEEPETREAAASQRERRRGPRRPVRPPTGFTPLLRLVALIAFAIVIVVLLVFWVDSCRGSSKRKSYENYMKDVSAIAADSAALGRQLEKSLTTPGVKQADVAEKLAGLAQLQQQQVERAQKLVSPGSLRSEQRHVVESLQFRVSGLRGLSDTFSQTPATVKDLAPPSKLLVAQSARLLASDVVWDDLFKTPSVAELKSQGIGGVAVPDSNFLVAGSDLVNPRTWRSVLQRLRGASTGGTTAGPHGNALVSVKVLPGGDQLSTSSDNRVTATTNLAFQVTIENSGASQEVQVQVVLTIPRSGLQPIVRRATIPSIDPGEQKSVTLDDIGQPPFGARTPVKVEVKPVKGETNTGNNSAEYQVFFSVVAP